jgi:hypothetical protein
MMHDGLWKIGNIWAGIESSKQQVDLTSLDFVGCLSIRYLFVWHQTLAFAVNPFIYAHLHLLCDIIYPGAPQLFVLLFFNAATGDPIQVSQ